MIRPVKPDMDNLVFTTAEALGYLRITYPTLRKIMKEGEIIPSRVGKRYRFLHSELDRYLTKPRMEVTNYALRIFKGRKLGQTFVRRVMNETI